MIDPKSLKDILHRELPRLDKLLIVLAAISTPSDVADIRGLAQDAGLRTKDWNISNILANSKGKAVRTTAGWELTQTGATHVRTLLDIKETNTPLPIAIDLRAEMIKITDLTTASFVDEAVRCYEAGVLRSAIVMSWLAAVDVIYNEVLTKKLVEFNALAANDKYWKAAADRDGLALMKEQTFLERAFAVGVITKNEKVALDECLRRRNTCGHPNSFKIGPPTVAHHIDTLIRNVFQKFA